IDSKFKTPPEFAAIKPKVFKGLVFGAPLESVMKSGIPKRFTEITSEGLFRKSPISTSLQLAKQLYESDSPVDIEELGGVHLSCTILKVFVRELPDPIFPKKMYKSITRIGVQPTKAAQIDYIKNELFPQLSPTSLALLNHIFKLLSEVSQNSKLNLMTTSNLTLIWSQNLLRSDNPMLDFDMSVFRLPLSLTEVQAEIEVGGFGTVVSLMIDEYDLIFGGLQF
ncbi:hypothetical protein HK096_000748, partial [Nowakowskiella sp. JEL0078]